MHKTISLIVEAKKKKVKMLNKSRKEILSLSEQAEKPVSFSNALNKDDGVSIIAEIKQASPSAGILRKDFNCLDILKEYEDCGASAISVVTEEEFFLGRTKYLKEVKENTSLPVLRKDFIIEDIQVYQSRALGADAILLIAKVLQREKLKELYDLSKSLGMDVLVEVHTLKELKYVLEMSPEIIGINNRNLDTFTVDLGTTLRLVPLIPRDYLTVSESGISSFKDILLLKGAGVNSVLIGRSLMETKDIKEKLKEFKAGCED